MKFARLLIIGFLAQWLSLATAGQTDPDDCRSLADDADRLNCYDAAFGRDPAADVPESRSGTAGYARHRCSARTGTRPRCRDIRRRESGGQSRPPNRTVRFDLNTSVFYLILYDKMGEQIYHT